MQAFQSVARASARTAARQVPTMRQPVSFAAPASMVEAKALSNPAFQTLRNFQAFGKNAQASRFAAPAALRALATTQSNAVARVVESQQTAASAAFTNSPAKQAPKAATSARARSGAANEALVFELGLSFVLSHYVHVFIALMRNAFQTFRPLLILFGFGQILKAAVFAMGAPMLVSFYSIWMFEVFYGLVQCIISFIFVSFFYNNMAFRGNRTAAARTLPQALKQTWSKLSSADNVWLKAARAVAP